MLRLPNEIAVGVAASNHRTMCKFDSPDQQRYKPIWSAIRKIAAEGRALQSPPITDGRYLAASPLFARSVSPDGWARVGMARSDGSPNGSDIKKWTELGGTRLHQSAELDDIETARRLVFDGAVIDTKDDLGRTPLYYALRARSKLVAQFLVNRGAEVLPIVKEVLANLGRSKGDESLRAILRYTASLKVPEPIVYSVVRCGKHEAANEWVGELLEVGFSPDERGSHGMIRGSLS